MARFHPGSNVIAFPLTSEDRLRIATRRLAAAMEAQAEAMAGLRAMLAPVGAPDTEAKDRVLN